jgi:8-oxo-dGTP pyrophosphatase MutT (NUDIX family)
VLRLLYRLYSIYLFAVRPVTLGVRVMLIRGQKVLLIRQTYMDGWFMPGGGLHRGETFEQAARREAHEEVGASIRRLSLLGAYSNFTEWKSDHNIVFLSTDFSLSGAHDREVAELRFFALDALPPGLMPGHRLRLEQYRAALKSARSSRGRRAARPDIPPFGEW